MLRRFPNRPRPAAGARSEVSRVTLKVNILVGTMTGTAEIVAEDVRDMMKEQGIEAELLLMDDLDAEVFKRPGIFLISTSTYGQGDVPDNAMKLYGKLTAEKPSLKGVRYGVIALGDRAYNDTFTHGGVRFDAILTELGATRVGEIFQHDASSDVVPEDAGVEWAKEWLKLLGA